MKEIMVTATHRIICVTSASETHSNISIILQHLFLKDVALAALQNLLSFHEGHMYVG